MVLKSKLFAIGFLMQDNLRCDENNNSRGPSQSAEPNDKSQECEQMININLPTINTVSSVNTNKTPSRENNGMVISTNNCISDSSNNLSSTGNFIQHDADVSLANSWFAINLSGCGTQCQPPTPAGSDNGTNKLFFVLYLQHGRHDVKCKPSIANLSQSPRTWFRALFYAEGDIA